jgi:hypothetical protein
MVSLGKPRYGGSVQPQPSAWTEAFLTEMAVRAISMIAVPGTPVRAFPPSISNDKNRRGTGKS